MSTLTTRIAGYKYVMRSATSEEIESHRATCEEHGWTIPDYSRATVGYFVDDNDVPQSMELPFELRSSRMTTQPQFMLDWADSDTTDLFVRVEDVAVRHSFDDSPCNCESCEILNAMYSRVYLAERKSLI